MEIDDKRLYHLFRKAGMDEDEAYTAVQEIRHVAGQNVIARIDAQAAAHSAQLKVQAAEHAAQLRELKAEMKAEVRGLHRIIGYAAVGVGLFFGFMQMLMRLMQ